MLHYRDRDSRTFPNQVEGRFGLRSRAGILQHDGDIHTRRYPDSLRLTEFVMIRRNNADLTGDMDAECLSRSRWPVSTDRSCRYKTRCQNNCQNDSN